MRGMQNLKEKVVTLRHFLHDVGYESSTESSHLFFRMSCEDHDYSPTKQEEEAILNFIAELIFITSSINGVKVALIFRPLILDLAARVLLSTNYSRASQDAFLMKSAAMAWSTIARLLPFAPEIISIVHEFMLQAPAPFDFAMQIDDSCVVVSELRSCLTTIVRLLCDSDRGLGGLDKRGIDLASSLWNWGALLRLASSHIRSDPFIASAIGHVFQRIFQLSHFASLGLRQILTINCQSKYSWNEDFTDWQNYMDYIESNYACLDFHARSRAIADLNVSVPLSLHPSIVNICGTFMLRRSLSLTNFEGETIFYKSNASSIHSVLGEFVLVPSSMRNLGSVASLTSQSAGPILLCGPSGSGKTCCVRALAHSLNPTSEDRKRLVELHLDDSVDAKSLLGSYVCGENPGEFIWKAGPLAIAMSRGDWVLIEDIDRAPRELLSALRPILEGQPVFVGSNRPSLIANSGFKIFGTASTACPHFDFSVPRFSTSPDPRDTTVSKTRPLSVSLFGLGDLFVQVHISSLNAATGEVADVIRGSLEHFPQSLIEPLLRSFDAIAMLAHGQSVSSPLLQVPMGLARCPVVRDVMKVARRVSSFMLASKVDLVSFKLTSLFASRVVAEIVDVGVLGSADDSFVAAAARALGAIWQLHPESIVDRCSRHLPEFRLEFNSQTGSMDGGSLGMGAGGCESAQVIIGRVRLSANVHQSDSISSRSSEAFAHTSLSLRIMERIAAAVAAREPVLIVGETGGGKTTLVQELAKACGHQLLVQNLSLHTDAADLVGGYRPVDARTIARPLLIRFLEIFPRLFSRNQNAKFLAAVSSLFDRKQWFKFTSALQDAIVRAFERIKQKQSTVGGHDEPSGKRPKISQEDQNLNLRREWLHFAGELDIFKTQIGLNVVDVSSDQESSDSPMTFAFQEGQLVRAIREGSWILLDEINLASAETLQRLSGLLEGSDGTIRVVERGDTLPLERHPNFRIFATMNPPTDAGKKDLPPALRSRFTELFVPESLSPPDLLLIANGYLKSFVFGTNTILPVEGENPHTASTDSNSLTAATVEAYLEYRKQAQSDVLVDGDNQRPRFSLRTFCRGLSATRALVKGTSKSGGYGGFSPQRAVFEGFALAFEISLDQNSKVVSRRILRAAFCEAGNSSKRTDGESKTKKKSKLISGDERSALESDHPSRRPGEKDEWVLISPFWLRAGPLPPDDWAEPDAATSLQRFVLTPHVASTLRCVAAAVAAGEGSPILLQGPTSAGKTSMVEYLAARTGHQCVRVNNHEHTDIAEYLGSYTASSPDSGGDSSPLVWSDGILVKALRSGAWIILDELNLAPSEVLEALNRLLDGNRELLIPETQEVVKPATGFLLFATQNPPGSYGGRKPLSRAFRNRFIELHVTDLPPPELETILTQRSGLPPTLSSLMVGTMIELQLRRQRSGLFQGKHSFVTARDLFKWAHRRPNDKSEAAVQGYFLLAERLRRDDEKSEVKSVLESVFGVEIDPVQVYQKYQRLYKIEGCEKTCQDMGIAITSSMSRLIVLLEECTRNKEPVLLVGDTGCGKTSCSQLLASRHSLPLHVVNFHQNSEASDLLGSLRPLRGRSLLRLELMEIHRLFVELIRTFPQIVQDNIFLEVPALQQPPNEDLSMVSENLKSACFLLQQLSAKDDFSHLTDEPETAEPESAKVPEEQVEPNPGLTSRNERRLLRRRERKERRHDANDRKRQRELELPQDDETEAAVQKRPNIDMHDPRRNGDVLHEDTEDTDSHHLASWRSRLVTLQDLSTQASSLSSRVSALFEWHDGPLVVAMQQGDFILLDEISLADDAVLERLNSVLEPSRTLTLAERAGASSIKGQTGDSVIVASNSFQVFATMNPGGDFGKRELSPALRSRFTEIWVPAVNSHEDVIAVINATLSCDAALSHAYEGIPSAMFSFSAWCGSRDSMGCSLSLRDLVTWAKFISTMCAKSMSSVDILGSESKEIDFKKMYRKAWEYFGHGACLVAIDGVGMIGTISLHEEEQNRIRSLCFQKIISLAPVDTHAILRQVLDDGESQKARQIFCCDFQKSNFGSAPFFIPCGPNDSQGPGDTSQGFAFDAPTTAHNAFRLLRAMQLTKPILLEGPPGVGKTSLIVALAAASGHPLTRINLSDQTDLSDLMGSDLPVPASDDSASSFAWRDGAFLRALKLGHWVLLDELNLAPQAVLEGLNSCLDHRAEVFVPELGRTFKCPSSFRVFGAQNPLSQGGGRKGLPASFLNRFARVSVAPLTVTDLTGILATRFPQLVVNAGESLGTSNTVSGTLLGKMVEFNNRVHNDFADSRHGDSQLGQLGRPWEFNLRDVFRWSELLIAEQIPSPGSTDWTPCSVVDTIYTNRLRSINDRRHLVQLFDTVFNSNESVGSDASPRRIRCSEASVELAITPTLVRIGSVILPRRRSRSQTIPSIPPSNGWVLPRAFLQPMQDLARCVRHGYCALIVGAAASGKSRLVRSLAESLNIPLREHTLTQTTDTSELLGGFEQVDAGKSDAQLALALDALIGEIIECALTEPSEQGSSFPSKFSDAVELRAQLRRRIIELKMSESPDLVYENQGNTHLSISSLWSSFQTFCSSTRGVHRSLVETVSGDAPTNQYVSSLIALARGSTSPVLVQYANRVDFILQHKNGLKSSKNGLFEWVDGILVEAMERGEWLLLDSVNLCSSSVLDRLNSLLEPGGDLLLTECMGSKGEEPSDISRNEGIIDTAPRRVIPAKGFRLFVSMDPAFGEVSRAMRNRCVEISLLDAEFSDSSLEVDSIVTDTSSTIVDALELLVGAGMPSDQLCLLCTMVRAHGLAKQEQRVTHRALWRWAELAHFFRDKVGGLVSALKVAFQTIYCLENEVAEATILDSFDELEFKGRSEIPTCHRLLRSIPFQVVVSNPLLCIPAVHGRLIFWLAGFMEMDISRNFSSFLSLPNIRQELSSIFGKPEMQSAEMQHFFDLADSPNSCASHVFFTTAVTLALYRSLTLTLESTVESTKAWVNTLFGASEGQRMLSVGDVAGQVIYMIELLTSGSFIGRFNVSAAEALICASHGLLVTSTMPSSHVDDIKLCDVLKSLYLITTNGVDPSFRLAAAFIERASSDDSTQSLKLRWRIWCLSSHLVHKLIGERLVSLLEQHAIRRDGEEWAKRIASGLSDSEKSVSWAMLSHVFQVGGLGLHAVPHHGLVPFLARVVTSVEAAVNAIAELICSPAYLDATSIDDVVSSLTLLLSRSDSLISCSHSIPITCGVGTSDLGQHSAAFLVHWRWFHKAFLAFVELAAAHFSGASSATTVHSSMESLIDNVSRLEERVSCLTSGASNFRDVLWKRGGHPKTPRAAADAQRLISLHASADLLALHPDASSSTSMTIRNVFQLESQESSRNIALALVAPISLRRDTLDALCALHLCFSEELSSPDRTRELGDLSELGVVVEARVESLSTTLQQDLALNTLKLASKGPDSFDFSDGMADDVDGLDASLFVGDFDVRTGCNSNCLIWRWSEFQLSPIVEHWCAGEERYFIQILSYCCANASLLHPLKEIIGKKDQSSFNVSECLKGIVPRLHQFIRTSIEYTFRSPSHLRAWQTLAWAIDAMEVAPLAPRVPEPITLLSLHQVVTLIQALFGTICSNAGKFLWLMNGFANPSLIGFAVTPSEEQNVRSEGLNVSADVFESDAHQLHMSSVGPARILQCVRTARLLQFLNSLDHFDCSSTQKTSDGITIQNLPIRSHQLVHASRVVVDISVASQVNHKVDGGVVAASNLVNIVLSFRGTFLINGSETREWGEIVSYAMWPLLHRTPPQLAGASWIGYLESAHFEALCNTSNDTRFRSVVKQLLVPAFVACARAVLVDSRVKWESSDYVTQGDALCLVGLLKLHLIVPSRPVDPVQAPLVKHESHIRSLSRLQAKLTIRRWANRLLSGQDKDSCVGSLRCGSSSQLLPQAQELAKAAQKAALKASERPCLNHANAHSTRVASRTRSMLQSNGVQEDYELKALNLGGSTNVSFEGLYDEITRFLSGLGSVSRIMDLRSKLLASSGPAELAQENSWQSSADSFLIRLKAQYGARGYFDITEPVESAVFDIKNGLRFLSASSSLPQCIPRILSSDLANTDAERFSSVMHELLIFPLDRCPFPFLCNSLSLIESPTVRLIVSRTELRFDESQCRRRLLEAVLARLELSLALEFSASAVIEANQVFDHWVKSWRSAKDEADEKRRQLEELVRYKTSTACLDESEEDAAERRQLELFPLDARATFDDLLSSVDLNQTSTEKLNSVNGEIDANESRDASWLCSLHARVFLLHSTRTSSGVSDKIRNAAFQLSYRAAKSLSCVYDAYVDDGSLECLAAPAHVLALATEVFSLNEQTDYQDDQLNDADVKSVDQDLARLLSVYDTAGDTEDGLSFDFHRSPAIAETKLLSTPLEAILRRLASLMRDFPDNSCLCLLVRIVDRLRQTSARAPLAQVVVGVQVLLKQFQQWEGISSRQYSLASEIKPLSGLLVRWRRLELVSWSAMLRTKERKHSELAHKTWFNLYSLINSNAEPKSEDIGDILKVWPSLVKNSPVWLVNAIMTSVTQSESDNFDDSARSLYSSVDQYLKNCRIGEFPTRLHLVRAFAAQMEINSEVKCEMRPMSRVLYALWRFYEQFLGDIRKKINEGKDPIEKKLKETVRLARWDEQTFSALEESSEKSHRKLSQLVSDYDLKVLSCSASDVIDASLVAGIREIQSSSVLAPLSKACTVVPHSSAMFLHLSEDDSAIESSAADGAGPEAHKHLKRTDKVTTQSIPKIDCGLKLRTPIILSSVSSCASDRFDLLVGAYGRRIGHLHTRMCSHLSQALVLNSRGESPSCMPYSLASTIAEELCEAVFSRLRRLRVPGTPKEAKRRALIDLLSALKTEGLHRAEASPPDSFTGHTLDSHILANVLVGAPLVLETLAVGSSESKAAHPLSPWNQELWVRADGYFYKCLAETACFRVEASGSSSPDIGFRERALMQKYVDRVSWLVLQQRALISALLSDLNDLSSARKRLQQLALCHGVSAGNQRSSKMLIQGLERVLELVLQFRYLVSTVSKSTVVPSDDAKSSSTGPNFSVAFSMIDEFLSFLRSCIAKVALSATEQKNILAIEEITSVLGSLKNLVKQLWADCPSGSPPLAGLVPIQVSQPIIDLLENLLRDNFGPANHDFVGDDQFKSCFDRVVELSLLTTQPFIKSKCKEEAGIPEDEEPELAKTCRTVVEEMTALRPFRLVESIDDLNGLVTIIFSSNQESDEVTRVMGACCHDVGSLVELVEVSIGEALSELIVTNKSTSKLNYILLRVFRTLLAKGFCSDEKREGQVGDAGGQDCGNFEDDVEGTGMGDGDGKKDVTDEIDDEEQLLGLQGDEEKDSEKENDSKKELTEEEMQSGMEMKENFDGDMFDTPKEPSKETDMDDGEDLDREMGEAGDKAEVIDQKLWGDDAEDDDGQSEGEEQHAGAPKFEEGSRLDGEALEDEVRTRQDDENEPGKDDDKSGEPNGKQPEQASGADDEGAAETNDDTEDKYEDNTGVDVKRAEEREGDEKSDGSVEETGEAENEEHNAGHSNEGSDVEELPSDMNLDVEDAMDAEDSEKVQEGVSPCDIDETVDETVDENVDEAPGAADEIVCSENPEMDIPETDDGGGDDDFEQKEEANQSPESCDSEGVVAEPAAQGDASAPSESDAKDEASGLKSGERQSKKVSDQMDESKSNAAHEQSTAPSGGGGGLSGGTQKGQSDSVDDVGNAGNPDSQQDEASVGSTNRRHGGPDMPNPLRQPGDASKHWNRRLDMLANSSIDQDEGQALDVPEVQTGDRKAQSDLSFEYLKEGTEQVMSGVSDEQRAAVPQELKSSDESIDLMSLDERREEDQMEEIAAIRETSPSSPQVEQKSCDLSDENPSLSLSETQQDGNNAASQSDVDTMGVDEDALPEDLQTKITTSCDDFKSQRSILNDEDITEITPEDAFRKLDEHEFTKNLLSLNSEFEVVDVDMPQQISVETDISPPTTDMTRSRQLWSRYCSLTAPLSQQLCEQLRLVLEPQVASRLRGDYRSGKRLNMRRIIPYIASGYRKDKIWLRRSRPSKRAYQVLLAIDDSRTMRENGAGAGALASLALLSTALNQLEVGQMAVMSFGDTVRVLHDFDDPMFGSEDGAAAISSFRFQGESTPVKAMLSRAISMFDAAASFGSGSGSFGGDASNQIMFVISDGRFDQSQLHNLRQLNRRLAEQKRLLVLLIVDAKPSRSIEKERRVIFDASGIRTPAYLEDYPFPYYAILKDISKLPQVLSDAIRQWFELLQQSS